MLIHQRGPGRLNKAERLALLGSAAHICYSTGDAPAAPAGGGTQTQQPNNQGAGQPGNQQTGNTGAGTQDNPGSGFDAASFWAEPQAKEPQSGTQPNGQQQQQQAPGKSVGEQFAESLSTMKFGDPVFSQDALEKLSSGDASGVNSAMEAHSRQAVQQAVVASAHIMKELSGVLQTKMASMIQEAMGNRDSNDTLGKEFPQLAGNPALRPMIEGVFSQAMKHTGNDRTKAAAMTRDLMKYMGANAGDDMGIERAPTSPGDTMTTGAKSLVDELLGR